MKILKRALDRLMRRGMRWRVLLEQPEKVKDMLANTTLEEFTAKLASGAPTPGGGSAAPLAGALSASLIQMVCDLTLGREKYKAHEEAVRAIRQKAEALNRDLLALVDKDADAYARSRKNFTSPKSLVGVMADC